MQRYAGWILLMVVAGSPVLAEHCERLTGMQLDHASVTRAQTVPAGTAIDRAGVAFLPAAGLAFCRIQVTAKPTADSDIRIELWVPSGVAWNGKFEQVGNGGFAGAVPYRSMDQVLAMGYAVAGTDDGHQSNDMTDASWALNHPEKIRDYGWRAIHETAVAAKALIPALTKRAATRAYFSGCSDGGREALMMAQRYPGYFDGIIAGAPAYAMTRLLSSGAIRSSELGGKPAYFPSGQLELLQHRAGERCGQSGPYLEDPRRCRVDVGALQCRTAASGTCLSAAQVKTAENLYSDRRDPLTGKLLYGFLPGAEAVKGSWDAWLTGENEGARPAAGEFSRNYLAYMVLGNSQVDPAQVTLADVARGERKISPVIDADSADLRAFRARGGKLIHYHGWNDPAIAPGYSLEYRTQLAAKTGNLDFYRLYMVPGMLHCSGGDAPTQVNWQQTLEAWVERGVPPGALTASDGRGATQTLQPFIEYMADPALR